MSSAERDLGKQGSFDDKRRDPNEIRISTSGSDLTEFYRASFERSLITINAERAKINLVCDLAGKRIYSIECYPRHSNGKTPSFGYRIFNFNSELEELFSPQQFNNLKGKDPLRYIAENINAELRVEKFHSDRLPEGIKLIDKYFGIVRIKTEPLRSFDDFLCGASVGSRTTVERIFNHQVPSSMTITFVEHDNCVVTRDIEITEGVSHWLPSQDTIYTDDESYCQAMMLATDRAILLFANKGVAKVREYLALNYVKQISIASIEDPTLIDPAPINLVDDIFREYNSPKLVNNTRFESLSTSSVEEFWSYLSGDGLKPKIRSTFTNNTPLKIVETNESDQSPFLARYNSAVGPISITLTSEPSAPGVYIGKTKTFLSPPFSMKFIRESFRDLSSAQISSRINALKSLVSSGYTIEVAKNSWDIEIVDQIKQRIEEKFGGANNALRWRDPSSQEELLDATMNFLRARQSIVVVNHNSADQSFSNMTIAVDTSGFGTIQMSSRFGVTLIFDISPKSCNLIDYQRKFLLDIIDDFSISPALVVERLIRETHFVEDRSVWIPGGDLKWGMDPSNWYYRINPNSAKTYHFVAAIYEFDFERRYGIKYRPFSEIIDPYVATLPESIQIRFSNTQGVSIDYCFNENGLIGLSVVARRKGLLGFFGAEEIFHKVSLVPSDDFKLARAKRVMEDTLGILTTISREQILNTNVSPLLFHLNQIGQRLNG